MSIITDLYQQLFGKDHIRDGNVIDFAEHGRAGGVDAGQSFKFTRSVDEKVVVDEPDANTTYIGIAKAGTATSAAAWQIQKISTSGTVETFEHADGDTNYDNIWDNRTTISYS